MGKTWSVLAAAGICAFWIGQAAAVNAPDYDIPYAAAQFAHEFPDSNRGAEGGNGYQLTGGLPLNFSFLPSKTALEVSFYDVGRKRHLDGNKDYQTAITADLVKDFGLYGWSEQGLRLKPFVLVGVGAVHEDVLGEGHWHAGVNGGGGVLLPTSFHGLALRTEGRLLYQRNDQSVAGQSGLLDWRVSVGLQIPLWFLADHMGKLGAAPECGVAVVGASGGRADCGADSDHDGVADAADQCPGTTLGTPVDAKGCPSGEAALMRNIQFKLDSAELTEDSKHILDGVAATLNAPESANVAIEVGGHTDAAGSDPYNLMLSQQRAESVKQYLIGRGVAAERLKPRGYGKAEPVADNSTEQGREENRRVTFRIMVE